MPDRHAQKNCDATLPPIRGFEPTPSVTSVFAYGEAANVFGIFKVVHRDGVCFFYISETYAEAVGAEVGSSLRVSGRRERLYRASLRRRRIRARPFHFGFYFGALSFDRNRPLIPRPV